MKSLINSNTHLNFLNYNPSQFDLDSVVQQNNLATNTLLSSAFESESPRTFDTFVNDISPKKSSTQEINENTFLFDTLEFPRDQSYPFNSYADSHPYLAISDLDYGVYNNNNQNVTYSLIPAINNDEIALISSEQNEYNPYQNAPPFISQSTQNLNTTAYDLTGMSVEAFSQNFSFAHMKNNAANQNHLNGLVPNSTYSLSQVSLRKPYTPRPRATDLAAEEKRIKHNELEKLRRKQVAENFLALNVLINGDRQKRSAKALLLASARETIISLSQEATYYSINLPHLNMKRLQLVEELEKLLSQTVPNSLFDSESGPLL